MFLTRRDVSLMRIQHSRCLCVIYFTLKWPIRTICRRLVIQYLLSIHESQQASPPVSQTTTFFPVSRFENEGFFITESQYFHHCHLPTIFSIPIPIPILRILAQPLRRSVSMYLYSTIIPSIQTRPADAAQRFRPDPWHGHPRAQCKEGQTKHIHPQGCLL